MRRRGSTRRRFNKVRFKRKVTISLILGALLVVGIKACGSESEQVKAEAAVSVTVEPTETYTYVPMARYPVPLDDDLQYFIIQLCEDHHIQPSIIFAMIDRESDFDADLVGDDGEAFGLMQIQPRWHYERMDELDCHDLLDPYKNVTVGIDYLAELLDYGNGLEWALMAYNGGPTYAYEKAALGIVTDYAQEVIENSEILAEGVQTVMYRTDDPIADFNAWDAEQARQEAKYPVCVYCSQSIQDYELMDVNGELYHLECAEDEFRRPTEDYME